MIRVRVPATSANLGAGFDCYGLALSLFNEMEVSLADETSLDITGEGADELPRDERNLVLRSLRWYFDAVGQAMPDVRISTRNVIPVSRGLGGSSAGIISGLMAGNALAGDLLSPNDLLDMAVAIEGHPDNVAPAMLGGIIVGVMDGKRLVTDSLPVPAGLRTVIFVPNFEMITEQARAILPKEVTRADVIYNLSRTALFAAAMVSGKLDLLREAMRDRLHQPYRTAMFPAMPYIIEAAVEAGALGACLSGAGSSILALVSGHDNAVSQAMEAAASKHGVEGHSLLLDISMTGAHTF
jgi:homoserine kinase